MTTIKITVEDEQANLLRKLLGDVSFITNIEEQHSAENNHYEHKSAHERIKKILNQTKGKNLFQDIVDPSEWQREIRTEWDNNLPNPNSNAGI